MIPKWICPDCGENGVHWFLPTSGRCSRCGKVVVFVAELDWVRRQEKQPPKQQRTLELKG